MAKNSSSADLVGKSYWRGLIFSIVFVIIIILIAAAGKILIRLGDGNDATLEIYLSQIVHLKWFGLITFVIVLFLVSTKVFGNRILDS